MTRILIVVSLLLAPVASLAQSDSHMEAAMRLVEVSGSDEILDQMFDAIMPGMMALGGDRDQMSDEEREVMDRYMERSLEILQEEMTWTTLSPYFAEIYANVYTEEEIHALIDFYSSDVGQKMLRKTPEIAAQTMQVMQVIMQRVTPRLQALSEELINELGELRK